MLIIRAAREFCETDDWPFRFLATLLRVGPIEYPFALVTKSLTVNRQNPVKSASKAANFEWGRRRFLARWIYVGRRGAGCEGRRLISAQQRGPGVLDHRRKFYRFNHRRRPRQLFGAMFRKDFLRVLKRNKLCEQIHPIRALGEFAVSEEVSHGKFLPKLLWRFRSQSRGLWQKLGLATRLFNQHPQGFEMPKMVSIAKGVVKNHVGQWPISFKQHGKACGAFRDGFVKNSAKAVFQIFQQRAFLEERSLAQSRRLAKTFWRKKIAFRQQRPEPDRVVLRHCLRQRLRLPRVFGEDRLLVGASHGVFASLILIFWHSLTQKRESGVVCPRVRTSSSALSFSHHAAPEARRKSRP